MCRCNCQTLCLTWRRSDLRHFQPPAPDVNAYTHRYWLLAAKDIDENPSGGGATTPRLCALSDLKAKLKTEMCKSHRLGSAKTDTGYYNYWKDLRPLVNKQATNAFWNNSNLNYTKSVMLWGTALPHWYNCKSKTRLPVRLLSQCKLLHLPLHGWCASHTLRLPTH